MAQKLRVAQTLDELINALLEHKLDLFFNRQLRVYRANQEFQQCFLKTNDQVRTSILNIWQKVLCLEDNSYLAKLILKLSVENFMLQITYDSMNRDWLYNYIHELKTLVNELKHQNDQ